MRYSDTANIIFTSADSKEYTIKDKRVIPNYTILTSVKKVSNILGDEIASKREIYGEGSEDLAYRIYEANIIDLLENRLDFDKLKSIKIPDLED